MSEEKIEDQLLRRDSKSLSRRSSRKNDAPSVDPNVVIKYEVDDNSSSISKISSKELRNSVHNISVDDYKIHELSCQPESKLKEEKPYSRQSSVNGLEKERKNSLIASNSLPISSTNDILPERKDINSDGELVVITPDNQNVEESKILSREQLKLKENLDNYDIISSTDSIAKERTRSASDFDQPSNIPSPVEGNSLKENKQLTRGTIVILPDNEIIVQKNDEDEEDDEEKDSFDVTSVNIDRKNKFKNVEQKILGVDKNEMRRNKALISLGVSNDDAIEAARIMQSIPVPTLTKEEKLTGYTLSQIKRRKALDVLGSTEESVAEEVARTLSSMGIQFLEQFSRKNDKKGKQRAMSVPVFGSLSSSVIPKRSRAKESY